jgi:hypothetical protein
MSHNVTFNLIDINTSGFHMKGDIEAKPILENGGVVLYKDEFTPTVASFVFGEICNFLIDPNLNGWWIDLRSDINNPSFYANDVYSQVQNNIVKIIVGSPNSKNGVVVGLCDFILPSWKDANSKNVRLNYMETLTTPFECSKYGSIIKFTPAQGVIQLFGENTSNWMQNFKNESYTYSIRKSFNK